MIRSSGWSKYNSWEQSSNLRNLYARRCNLESEEMTCAAQAIEILAPYASKGDSLLDIGCGSGLHSISAKLIGFKKVVSVDYDINSVSTTIQNAEKFGVEIDVFEDDILNTNIDKKFDVVYMD